MKKTFTLLATVLVALLSAGNCLAGPGPDAPGSKLVTVQVGGFPGFGGIVSGNIAMANLGSAHLYGGLQAGAAFAKGSMSSRSDFSLAPRLMLGFNLSNVVEFHVGGLAGIDVRRITESRLIFCYGGVGGFRFNLSPSLGLLAEGCYSPQLPYATVGLAFTF